MTKFGLKEDQIQIVHAHMGASPKQLTFSEALEQLRDLGYVRF